MTVAAVLALDQLTKYLVRQKLPVGTSWPTSDTLVSRFFTFTHVENTGVSFGLFQGHSEIFVLVALAVVAGILVYRRHVPQTDTWLNVATGLIVGGALGNVVDRILIGHVVDFLHFKVWPVFNVADSSVFVGVVMLTIHVWRDERARQSAERSEVDPSTSAQLAEAAEEPGD